MFRRLAILGTSGAAFALLGCSAPADDLLEAPSVRLSGPTTVALGWVAVGEQIEGRFEVVNAGEADVFVNGIEWRSTPQGAGHRFVAGAAPGRLAVGESRLVSVTLDAFGEGPRVSADLAVAIEGLPAGDLRSPTVTVTASVSPTGLRVEPDPLVIGPVPFTQSRVAPLRIINLRSTPASVIAPNVNAGRIQYDEVVGRGRFGELPVVDDQGQLATIPARSSIEVELSYTAPGEPSEGKEQAEWRIADCPRPQCEVDIIVQGQPDDQGPRIVLQPDEVLEYGDVPVGATSPLDVIVENVGGSPLTVDALTIEGDAFTATPWTATTLAPGEFRTWPVRFTPTETAEFTGVVRASSNDPARPTVVAGLLGNGVILPPCDFEIAPPEVVFGRVALFRTELITVTIFNVGADDCLLFDFRVSGSPAFRLPDGSLSSARVGPGGQLEVLVAFEPTEPGTLTGELRIQTSNPDEPIVVPLSGEGGSGLGLRCSPPQSTVVGVPVRLVVTEGEEINAVQRRWTIVSAPPGGIGTPNQFDPDPPTGTIVEFLPLLVGRYNIEAEVTDAMGRTETCLVVVVAEGRGLQATLTWDGPGDLDLHMHRATTTPWFTTDDCYFDNPEPRWTTDAQGVGRNPRLDIDNTTGEGPENIRLEEPEVGVTYTVAVDHFANAAGRRARLQLFCGPSPSPQLDETSRPLRGTNEGFCRGNDFWVVATVRFTAAQQCVITPVDTYRTSSDACERF